MPRLRAFVGVLLVAAWPDAALGRRVLEGRPDAHAGLRTESSAALWTPPGIAAATPAAQWAAEPHASHRALEVRGGFVDAALPAVGAVTSGALSSAKTLQPLLTSLDFPVRATILAWTVYDKTWRALKIVTPTPALHDSDAHILSAASTELQVLDTVKRALQKSKIARRDKEARKLRRSLILRLAANIARVVKANAQLAMRVGAKTFQRRGAQGPTVRVADGADCGESGACEPLGQSVDLSCEALAEAAELDVSRELVPQGELPTAKLSLLGLVAALGHEAVFKKVQLLVRPKGRDARLMTIADFKKAQGINGVLDLLRAVVHKYKTPATLANLYIALYTVSTLRLDPDYFQISWGLRLGGILSGHRVSEGKRGLIRNQYSVSEFVFRFSQVVDFSQLAVRQFGLSAFDHLRCANAALACILHLQTFAGSRFARVVFDAVDPRSSGGEAAASGGEVARSL